MTEFITMEMLSSAFEILDRCKGVEQNPLYHPEIDVLEHSLQCFYRAAKECDDVDLCIAALFHDVGKQIDNKGHENYSVDLLKDHLSPKALWLIENHMKYWYFVLGSMKRLQKVKLMDHVWLPQLTFLARFDKMARIAGRTTRYEKDEIIFILNNKVSDHFQRSCAKIEEIEKTYE